MMVYYSLSGFIADLALLFNIIFIMAGLAFFGATLTLPGIAGIILTIGMAVDANVLIFERIREELRLGKSPRASIEGGYSKALVTILDANFTTLIVALVLFQFGTGPVRGFAVTLSLGILASLFTAIFVTRIVFDYLYVQRRIQKLWI
jgi:preprotein translocase subunit SecD